MRNQKGFSAIFVLAIVVTVGVVGFAGWRAFDSSEPQSDNLQIDNNETSNQVQATEQKLKDPQTEQELAIASDEHYWIKLSDDEEYFGKLAKINDEYVKLSGVVYPREPGSENYVTLGDELHGPESVMYIRIASLESIKELSQHAASQTIQKAISKRLATPVEDAFPSQNIKDYIKADKYQAFFMKDGKSFFTSLSSLEGNLLSSKQVFTLRVNQTQTTSNDISLVLAEEGAVAGYTASDIIFWENLKGDAQIPTAIDQFNAN